MSSTKRSGPSAAEATYLRDELKKYQREWHLASKRMIAAEKAIAAAKKAFDAYDDFKASQGRT